VDAFARDHKYAALLSQRTVLYELAQLSFRRSNGKPMKINKGIRRY